MAKIVRLIVKGFVQGVGFRTQIKQIAYKLSIFGVIKNLPDGSVEIYCNAQNDGVYENFKKSIKEDIKYSEVKEIEEHLEGSKEYGEGPKEWTGFNLIRGEYGEVEETLGFMALTGRDLLEKQDVMIEKQDVMIEKQGETINIIKNTNQNIKDMDSHMNENFNKLDKKYDKFGNSLTKLEGDMKDIKGDIHGMKEAFTKLVNHFVKDD